MPVPTDLTPSERDRIHADIQQEVKTRSALISSAKIVQDVEVALRKQPARDRPLPPVEESTKTPPWHIAEIGGRFCVIADETGQSEGCHDTRADAEAHLAALYANVPDVKAADTGILNVLLHRSQTEADAILELYGRPTPAQVREADAVEARRSQAARDEQERILRKTVTKIDPDPNPNPDPETKPFRGLSVEENGTWRDVR